MNQLTTTDGTQTEGRKGLPYDWQSLYASAAADRFETELAHLAPTAP